MRPVFQWMDHVICSGMFTSWNQTGIGSQCLDQHKSYWELLRSDHKKCLSEHFLSLALAAEELWPGRGPISGDYRICRVILWGWCLWKGSERSTPTLVSDQQAGSAKVNRVKRGCHHILCRGQRSSCSWTWTQFTITTSFGKKTQGLVSFRQMQKVSFYIPGGTLCLIHIGFLDCTLYQNI